MRIAVITPAFNAECYIADAIDSVQAQTYDVCEMIIVDDGSTDGTAERVRQVGGQRTRLVCQEHEGVSAARNCGLLHARDWDAVLFLDADDWLAPDALEHLAYTLRSASDRVAAVAPARFVSNDGGSGLRRSLRPGSGDLLYSLLQRNLFANGGHVLIKREAICAAGLFRTDLSFGEDWEYWIRLALNGPFVATQSREPLLFVRERPDGAYLRREADPNAIMPCLDAIFGNPELATRFDADRLRRLRRRAEAEIAWVVGSSLMRTGESASGVSWLLRSVAMRPSAKRSALLGAKAVASLWHARVALGV